MAARRGSTPTCPAIRPTRHRGQASPAVRSTTRRPATRSRPSTTTATCMSAESASIAPGRSTATSTSRATTRQMSPCQGLTIRPTTGSPGSSGRARRPGTSRASSRTSPCSRSIAPAAPRRQRVRLLEPVHGVRPEQDLLQPIDQRRQHVQPAVPADTHGFSGSVQGCDIAIEGDGDVYVTFRTFADTRHGAPTRCTSAARRTAAPASRGRTRSATSRRMPR